MLTLHFKRPTVSPEPHRDWCLRIPSSTQKPYPFCEVSVTWGDGSKEALTDVSYLHWTVPAEYDEFTVTIEGEIPSLCFSQAYSDEVFRDWLYEVDGVLPRLTTGVSLFQGCYRLNTILNDDFFVENHHWTDITSMFDGCTSYRPNWNIWKPLTNIEIAFRLHKANACIYQIPANWCSHWNKLYNINEMFTMNDGLQQIHVDCFRENLKLQTANHAFSYCQNLSSVGILFDRHPELISAQYLFACCPRLQPVHPNYRNFFQHPEIDVTGIFRDSHQKVFLFAGEE